MNLGKQHERRDQLQQIAETALELFGSDFTSQIHADRTTADVVCGWLRMLAVMRRATGRGVRVQSHLCRGRGDGI